MNNISFNYKKINGGYIKDMLKLIFIIKIYNISKLDLFNSRNWGIKNNKLMIVDCGTFVFN